MSRRQIQLNRYSETPFNYAAIGDNALASEAQAAAERIRGLQRATIVDIGKELMAMKDRLGHGHFLPWVASLGIARRTAESMMTVALQFGDEAKWATVAHLPTKLLYDLAAPSTPDVVRNAVLATEPERFVNPVDLRRVIVQERQRDNRAKTRAKIRETYGVTAPARLDREQEERARTERRQAEADRLARVVSIIVGALGSEAHKVAELLNAGIAFGLEPALKVEVRKALSSPEPEDHARAEVRH